MPALAEELIRQRLLTEFPALQVHRGAHSTLEIPAAHAKVGPLYIQLDPDEITVFVGPAHCHFERFDDAPEKQHISEALAFIRGVLRDEIVLWSCLGAAGAYKREHRWRLEIPWLLRRYLWSGPVS